MNPTYRVRTVKHDNLHRVQGMWPDEVQRKLLERLLDERSDLTGDELTEMLELALQDLPAEDAAVQLLEVLFGKAMSKGMREDVARDMMEGEPWVHHSHLEWHRGLFEASWLANRAHASAFTRPHGARLTLEVEALDDEARATLDAPVTPALAARLMVGCIPDSIMARLFEDELASRSFKEAQHVVWFAAWSSHEGSHATLTLEGSDHWFGAVEPGAWCEVSAWPDVDHDETR